MKRPVWTHLKTTGAGETVYFYSFTFIDVFGSVGRTGSNTFTAINACLVIYPYSEDASILNKPTEKPKWADPLAVTPIVKDRGGKDDGYDDGRCYAKVPFKDLERVKISVN